MADLDVVLTDGAREASDAVEVALDLRDEVAVYRVHANSCEPIRVGLNR